MCGCLDFLKCNSAYLCSRLDWRRWPPNTPASSTWLQECCCKNWFKPSASPSTPTFLSTRCINTRHIHVNVHYLRTPDSAQLRPRNSFCPSPKVHERTDELDFLLLVLRKLLCSNSPYVKVITRNRKSKIPSPAHLHQLKSQSVFSIGWFQIILMSATINCRQFAEYFGTTVRGKMNPAYVFEVEGVPHAIEEFYLDDLQPYRVRGRLNSAAAASFFFFKVRRQYATFVHAAGPVASCRLPWHFSGDVQSGHQSYPELWWDGGQGIQVGASVLERSQLL